MSIWEAPCSCISTAQPQLNEAELTAILNPPQEAKGQTPLLWVAGVERTGGKGSRTPPLVTQQVTTFGHEKSDQKLAVLGSPQSGQYTWEGGGVMQQHT